MIHVFIGTKAQYIKTAPLLTAMDAEGVPYRLIDSGQHAAFSLSLRSELGVREPDYRLREGKDVDTIRMALWWFLRQVRRLGSAHRLETEVFGGRGGVCVVHGDTPSTLLGVVMARRAGLTIAHMEAGLRSRSIFHPFPEELIRVIVMRCSDLLFAPSEQAAKNLDEMSVRGRVVVTSGNTIGEAVGGGSARPGGNQARSVFSIHRVENLRSRRRMDGLRDLVLGAARIGKTTFVAHPPTYASLVRRGDLKDLEAAGVRVTHLLPHEEFLGLLRTAEVVVTDGGSVQEECALLGVPTVLWRRRTEREDGLGVNVVLSAHDFEYALSVVTHPHKLRAPSRQFVTSPSTEILRVLLEEDAISSPGR